MLTGNVKLIMLRLFQVYFLFCGFFSCFYWNARAQGNDTVQVKLSLRNVVYLAKTQSSSVKYVQNRDVNYYWRYKNFQTQFMPQLDLSGNMPYYINQISPVQQPDGSVEFIKENKLEVSDQISLRQSIPFTGAHISASTSLLRLEDFVQGTSKYTGSPFKISITQPIFSYNWMKWYKITEPLVYEEAQKDFIESMEEIAITATDRFFDYLKIQTNFNLAKNNLKNSQDNLKIAKVRQKLGTISENDFARIQLTVYNAQKALSKARMDLKNADFELKSYIGLDQNQVIELDMPLEMYLFEVDKDKALDEALANRKEVPHYERRLILADRDLVQAKRDNGLSASLRASYGVDNEAAMLSDIYNMSEGERSQVVKLGVSIPIMDWGRSESKVRLAESRRDLVIFDVEKEKQDFERRIIVQVERFSLLEDQIKTAEEADKVAESGYKIALQKFQNGEISISDLNISLQEREQAKRDYIATLETYWKSYYQLRELTLYDFELNNKIWYDNPMLSNQE